jgi:hypothetical protein
MVLNLFHSATQAIMLLTCIREGPSSNLGWEWKYTEESSAFVVFSTSKQMLEQYHKWRLNGLILRPFWCNIHYHHITLCCLVCVHHEICYLRNCRSCCRHSRRELYLKDQIHCFLTVSLSVFNRLSKQTNLTRTVPAYRIILGHSCCSSHHSAWPIRTWSQGRCKWTSATACIV